MTNARICKVILGCNSTFPRVLHKPLCMYSDLPILTDYPLPEKISVVSIAHSWLTAAGPFWIYTKFHLSFHQVKQHKSFILYYEFIIYFQPGKVKKKVLNSP